MSITLSRTMSMIFSRLYQVQTSSGITFLTSPLDKNPQLKITKNTLKGREYNLTPTGYNFKLLMILQRLRFLANYHNSL